MLEKKIETAVCDYAKTLNILVYKFTSPARAAVPDRLFILPNGDVFFIEFKRKGAKCTPAQLREHERLRSHNVIVAVIDDIQSGKDVIDLMSGLKDNSNVRRLNVDT